MNRRQSVRFVLTIGGLAAIALAGVLLNSPIATADDDDRNSPTVRANDDEGDVNPLVKRGFKIAPVPLKLHGKSRELVGLGSYLVNAAASCNDCHSAGTATQYAMGGNPFFGLPKIVNQATYLGGGRDFGPFPGSPGPNRLTHVYSRNLTPDKTGLPAGGRTWLEFRQIMRTGVDLDHLHKPCSATLTSDCLPAPFDSNLLQVMPWPVFQNMTDHDLRAIYEYLSAVPCIEGPTDPTNVLHNDCV